MSIEQLSAFGMRVQEDEALRAEIADLGQDSAGIVAVAQREGFDFTEAELNDYLQTSASRIGAELDEADLEQVVGGGAYTQVTCQQFVCV